MKVSKESINNNKEKLTITVDNAEFLKAEDKAFEKNKSKFKLPGFRKGHVAKEMVFQVYGRGVLYEDAANDCINKTYYEAIKEAGSKILSRPEIELLEVGSDKDLVYTATFAVVPEFKVAKYKGIDLTKTKVSCTEDDIKAKLLVEQDKNARMVSVDRAIAKDDVVTIDFEGFIDGVAFKGGKGTDYPLTIGSHSFIDTFEDQLIGHKIDEEVDVNVTFPADYGEKSLAGKPALFKVKIKEVKVKELPEINDEFISEISEFDKLDDYKADIKKKILEEGAKKAIQADKQKLLEKIVTATDIDLADEAIEASIDDIKKNLENRLYYQRISFDDYLKMTNQNYEQFREAQKPQAIANLKSSLVLEEIGRLENITASDEKVEENIKNMATAYGMPLDKFKQTYITDEERENIKKDLLFPTVMDFIYENANLKD